MKNRPTGTLKCARTLNHLATRGTKLGPSSASNYEERFYEILTGFEEKLSKIDIGGLLVAVEAAIYIQNPNFGI